MGRNGYDLYLKNHIGIYGETPETALIGMTHEHLDLWDTGECTQHTPKIMNDASAFAIHNAHTNTWYEINAENEMFAVLDSKHYERWHAPMPYWIYSRG